jgi:glycosyltransferase involved in cell wall biosynthesis
MSVDAQGATRLSIVIPLYNEPDWIGRSVSAAVAAVRNSPFRDSAELVIVDDGSDHPTKSALASLAPGIPHHVIAQENSGRFAARQAGIRHARGEHVLLLDSRVLVDPRALGYVAARVGEGAGVWNAHVEVDVEGNPFARFWRTITYAAWRDYLANPRTTSFGLEEYDRYPKGTTCFLAPRLSLLRALDGFHSLYGDLRHANDDTILIRSLAAEQRINISPSFACTYVSRDSWRGFLKHSFHRGTVFLDAYGRPGTRFFMPLMAFFPATVAGGLLAARRPRTAAALAAMVPLAGAAFAAGLRRPARDVAAFALLSGPFAVAYGAGIYRGAAMALRQRSKR